MAEKCRIAIVGSGPAGLSAASHAARLGLSHVLLEKTDHLSDTIYRYQKGKHVMATPAQLVLRADLDFAAGKREAVLGTWNEQSAKAKLNVRFHADAVAILEATLDRYPASPNAYDSLSEVLEAAGRRQESRHVVLRGLDALQAPAVSAGDREAFTRMLRERLARLDR